MKSHLLRTPRLSAALVPLGWALGTLSPAGNAAEDFSRWRLNSKVEAGVGYDSNIFARAHATGDGYAEVEPRLILARLPSLTLLTFEAAARVTGFFHLTHEDSIDPSFRAKYRFPDEEGALSSYEMDAGIAQSSRANPDVARRVRETDWSFRWEGMVPASTKAALRASILARRLSYREWDLNSNESVDAGLTLAFVSTKKLELGIGYDLSFARSIPSTVLSAGTRRIGHALTLRGRGEFSPTLAGKMVWGVTRAHYSESQNRSEIDFVVGADLTWAIRERRAVTLRADRQVYFSPEGDAVRETGIEIELLQEFAGGFAATVGAQATRRVYRRTMVYRRDTSFPLRAGVRYGINSRFTAALDLSWSRQQSDWDFRNYRRTTAEARAYYQY